MPVISRSKYLEADSLSAFDRPIRVNKPESWTTPIIFSSPHSGRLYPDSFVSRSKHDLNTLRRNEDAYVDELYDFAPLIGAPILSALFPRSFVDVNRAEDELPSQWIGEDTPTTVRADMGLGVVPTMIGENQPIYKRQLKPWAVKCRIQSLYRPYHAALRELIRDGIARFGQVLLIDCHSMPGFRASGQRRADIVLGDRYGTSCHSDTIEQIHGAFACRDYVVTRNHPYAGSFITSHYGRPSEGVEAIQIELNRDLYLHPDTLETKPGYDTLRSDLEAILREIAQLRTEPMADAAE